MLIVVLWVGLSQFVTLLFKKEKDLRIYLSIFSLTLISFLYYSIVYEKIFPLNFHLFEILMDWKIQSPEINGLRTPGETFKFTAFILTDLVSRILLRIKFFRLYEPKKKSLEFIAETLNYVLTFTVLSFIILLILIALYLLSVFITN